MHVSLYVNTDEDLWKVRILSVEELRTPTVSGFIEVFCQAENRHEQKEKRLILDLQEDSHKWAADLLAWLTGWRREKLLHAFETKCEWTAPSFQLDRLGERLEQRIDLWNQANAA